MRWLVVLTLMLGACSKGADADLEYIGQARSLGAEWALVNEQASHGKLTPIYPKTMRQRVRQQLQTTAKALTHPDSRYGAEIAALLAEPDDAPPDELRAHADKLKQIEDGLESA